MLVVVADDFALTRTAFARILDSHPFIDVVARAMSWPQACAFADDLAVDVLLCDLRMIGRDAFAALADLRAAQPDLAIVLMSVTVAEGVVRDARAAGASVVVSKLCTPTELRQAVLGAGGAGA